MATIDLILGTEPKAATIGEAAGTEPKAPILPGYLKTDATKIVGKPGEREPVLAKSSSGLEEPRRLTYQQMFEMMNPEKPETPEEKAKREKKEKWEGIFSAIGDGISAMSNLWFTSRGAPNAYNPSSSMSAATKARWDKLKAEREAIRNQYNNGLMTARMKDQQLDWRQQQWDYQKERDKKMDEYRDAKEQREADRAERQAALDDAKLALTYGKLTHQGYMNYIAEVKAGKIEALTDAQINRLNRTGTGGGKTGGKKYYGSLPDRYGNNVEYYSKADYEAALNEPWRGISPDREVSSTKTETSGRKTKTTTATKSKVKTTGEKAGEARGKAEKGKNTKNALKEMGI